MTPGAVILLCIGAFLVACALHPFVTYPLSLALFATRRKGVTATWSERPPVAILLCAYNEEVVIADKLRSLIAAATAYGPATVHVYTDGCSDRTVDRIQPFADQLDLVVSTERRGKTHGMNVLMDRSDSALVMFSDANVMADDTIVQLLALPFGDPAVGCTTACLRYSNGGESATSLAGSIYWVIEEAIKRIESETVGVIGVDGASFMIRRALYRRVPDHLIDDLFITLHVLATGASVIRVPEAVVHERSAVRPGEEYHRKVRIACQAIGVHRHLWPVIRRSSAVIVYAYVSHRLMKWLIPFFLAGAGLACVAAFTMLFGWSAIALAAVAAGVVVIGGIANVPGLALLYTIGLSLFGVMHGITLGLFTDNAYRIWDPAASVRSVSSRDAS